MPKQKPGKSRKTTRRKTGGRDRNQPMLEQAHRLFGRGDFDRAETLYQQVLRRDPENRDALQSLVAIFLQPPQRFEQAERLLQRLVVAYPAEPGLAQHYANVMMQLNKPDKAIASIRTLLQHRPELTDTRYNFARLLKHTGHLREALEEYRQTLDEGISRPEEVFSNMSVILSDLNRTDDARAALHSALALRPDYEPGLYNLALLEEESGHWPQAEALLQRILAGNPEHVDALVRLAEGKERDLTDPVVGRLKHILGRENLDDPDREKVNFALGKVHDECGDYGAAFRHYSQGNFCSRHRLGRYDAAGQAGLTRRLMRAFPARSPGDGDVAPVFICGMFRSGSTLTEQMLAAHPDIQPGGEISYFDRHLPLPASLDSPDRYDLQAIARGYLDFLDGHFTGPARVTNKRPDNFLYLGFILSLFPKARIINTHRFALDNCLSVYFQPMETRYGYATDLMDIGHFYVQYRTLMDHWRRLYPGSIVDVDYDELVRRPRRVLEPVFDFLDLDWDDRCLEFFAVASRVRTASVWQVRQPLHDRSSGRWRHYADEVDELKRYLEDALGPEAIAAV